ncbi:hypothetical protein COCHEDRAFT_1120378 [Bipolaris maydis C5]|uniref:Zn(2)-C6 fungal-type domain-containing protein n=1 Tax=Cochliobolus heterostrophus (strain C5 / ATCC 48332 / race O) TaxID=701091 RepID=M2UAL9_COCH5|nr:hypothetical protein COCHEDRAFT_1120378 [Bipolaris maydis C5]
MPKVPSSRRVRAQGPTSERRARADRVKEQGNEMTFRCKRCEEKNLRCFVDTATGRCAGCISIAASCSLFVSEDEWEKVQAEKRAKRLEVARLKAQLAQSELELLEAEAREQEFADRDLAILNLQDRAKEQAEGNSAPGTDLPVATSSLSGPTADPGWLQADSFDPLSLDYFLSLKDPVLSSLDAACDTLVLDRFDHILVVLEFDVFC